MPISHPIRDGTVSCQALFGKCIATASGVALTDWFETRQGEFNLWSAGLKATKVNKSSLEYRVRYRNDIRELICDLLEGLAESLEWCLENDNLQGDTEERDQLESSTSFQIASTSGVAKDDMPSASSGFRGENGDSDGEGPGSSFSEQLFYIKNILSQLARLSMAIRRSGNKYRHEKADENLQEEDFEEFKVHLTVLILTGKLKTDPQKALSDLLSIVTDMSRLTTAQHILIRYNVLRRNRIMYATRDSHANSGTISATHPIQPQPDTPEMFPLQYPTAKSLSAAMSSEPMGRNVTPGDRFSSSVVNTATEIGSQLNAQGTAETQRLERRTSSTVTKVTRTAATRDYPSPPRLDQGDTFQCPYCANILPAEISKDLLRWRGHVAEDLLPYNCIFEQCGDSHELYMTSNDLSKHTLENHGVTHWVCDHCSSKADDRIPFTFMSFEEWQDHMNRAHSGAFESVQLVALGEISQRRMIEALSCPLCDFESKQPAYQIDEHIVQHLHEFSLRSLPWTFGNQDSEFTDAAVSEAAIPLSLDGGNHQSDTYMDFSNEADFIAEVSKLHSIITHIPENPTWTVSLVRDTKALNPFLNSSEMDEAKKRQLREQFGTMVSRLIQCLDRSQDESDDAGYSMEVQHGTPFQEIIRDEVKMLQDSLDSFWKSNKEGHVALSRGQDGNKSHMPYLVGSTDRSVHSKTLGSNIYPLRVISTSTDISKSLHDRFVRLAGGKLQGIKVLSRYAILPYGSKFGKEFQESDFLAQVRVLSVKDREAKAQVEAMDDARWKQITRGCPAILRELPDYEKFTVSFVSHGDNRGITAILEEAWAKHEGNKTWLSLSSCDSTDASFTVAVAANKNLRIRNAPGNFNDTPWDDLQPLPYTDIPELLRQLEHIARYTVIKELGTFTVWPSSRLVSVKVRNAASGKAGHHGLMIPPARLTVLEDEAYEHSYEVEAETGFSITVKNESQRPLGCVILDCASDLSVERVYPVDRKFHTLEVGQEITTTLAMSISGRQLKSAKAGEAVIDTLKIIVCHPEMAMDSLQLPGLFDTRDRAGQISSLEGLRRLLQELDMIRLANVGRDCITESDNWEAVDVKMMIRPSEH